MIPIPKTGDYMVMQCLSALLVLVNGLLIAVNSGPVQAQGDVRHGVILQYHHVSDSAPASTRVTPKAFRRHMEILKEDGFNVWPLARLVAFLQQDKALPDKTVVITIDDAYLDVYQNAAPILNEFGYPFTLFVSTDPVDQKLRGFMSWDQLRELQKQGAQLANHTQSHLHLLRKLEGESESEWLARIEGELKQSEARIAEETGANWKYFAYPYGEVNERLLKKIQEWGFLGFGQQSGAVDKALLNSGIAPRFPFNEHYVDEKAFRLKAASLPLPIAKESSEPIVWSKPAKPQLKLTLTAVNGALTCFASDQGEINVVKTADKEFTIQSDTAIPVGRSRYNCTMPVAGQQGRYHWYSKTWIRKRDDGSWYRE
ncbi:polysaccharide deacetylase family protein [Ketobacter sp. MCCC 1A13808]|nr:polysaccharide deacetylase family protein [Ketobacter sp. MCCC 1A13808]